MPPNSNHQTEDASYGGQSFRPFEFDTTVEPDLADGRYTGIIDDVKFRMSNPDATTGDSYPQLLLEWKAEETAEESEACQRSVGNTVSEFLTFRPKGDRKGNMSKQRLVLLRNRFGIETDVLPAQITSPADFDELRAALKGQRTEFIASSKPDKTGAMRTNLQILSDGAGDDQPEEVQPARAAARQPTSSKKAAPAARKAARR